MGKIGKNRKALAFLKFISDELTRGKELEISSAAVIAAEQNFFRKIRICV
jgi:hypothetical protein